MHPLHATLEEFATEGYTHQLPALLRETIAGNRPACENLDGTYARQISTRLRCANCGGYSSVKSLGSRRML